MDIPSETMAATHRTYGGNRAFHNFGMPTPVTITPAVVVAMVTANTSQQTTIPIYKTQTYVDGSHFPRSTKSHSASITSEPFW